MILYLWIGELGRELIIARPQVLWLLNEGYNVEVVTHKSSQGLYPCKTFSHGIKKRLSSRLINRKYKIPKGYTMISAIDKRSIFTPGKEYKPLGEELPKKKRVLFHGRWLDDNKQGRNWFEEYDCLIDCFKEYEICSIGLKNDRMIPRTKDCRGYKMKDLIRLINESEFVIAPVGGIAVLALHCLTPVISWGGVRELKKGGRWNLFNTNYYEIRWDSQHKRQIQEILNSSTE